MEQQVKEEPVVGALDEIADSDEEAKTVMQFLVQCLLQYTARPENKALLQGRLVDPVIHYIGARLWPYILGAALYLAALTMLLLAICYFAVKKR